MSATNPQVRKAMPGEKNLLRIKKDLVALSKLALKMQ